MLTRATIFFFKFMAKEGGVDGRHLVNDVTRFTKRHIKNVIRNGFNCHLNYLQFFVGLSIHHTPRKARLTQQYQILSLSRT